MADSSPKGKKTLWKKDKSLITIRFSLSSSLFKRFVWQTHKNVDFFGKGNKGELFNQSRNFRPVQRKNY